MPAARYRQLRPKQTFFRWLKLPRNTGVAPTSMFAANNVITVHKELFVVQETGLYTCPEQEEKVKEWLPERLLSQNEHIKTLFFIR